jgi:hypothetical protein
MKNLILHVLFVVLGSASVATAVTVTDVTTATTVFKDDFESGNFAPSVGTWTVGPNVTVTTAPSPGPYQGSFYAQIFRDSNTASQGNLAANLSTSQNTPGDLIRLDMMVYLPASTDVNVRGQFMLTAGDFNTARAWVRPDGAGNVIAVTAGTTLVDTGLDYLTGVWQRWQLDYVIGSSTFDFSINGVQAKGFSSVSSGPVSVANIFNGSTSPGSFYVDAVPEPSTWGLLLSAGIICFGVHCHKAKRHANNGHPASR